MKLEPSAATGCVDGSTPMAWHGMAWHGMAEVCEGAPVAVSGWVLADRHDARPCAASSLHRGTTSVSDMIGGTGKLGTARPVTQSAMLVLGSVPCAPKEPCPSVASPKRVLLSSLGGLWWQAFAGLFRCSGPWPTDDSGHAL